MSVKPFPCTSQVAANIRSGRQTQDRRPINPQPEGEQVPLAEWTEALEVHCTTTTTDAKRLEKQERMRGKMFPFRDARGELYAIEPPWKRGDVLWVREPGRVRYVQRTSWIVAPSCYLANIEYPADGAIRSVEIPKRLAGRSWLKNGHGIPNGIFKEAARAWLEVTDVRVQRIRDITPADAIAEGLTPATNSLGLDCDTPNPVDGFHILWDSIYAARGYGWDVNPWVWVYEFERTDKPEGWPS